MLFDRKKSEAIARDLLNMKYEKDGRGPSLTDCYGILVYYYAKFGLVLPDYSSQKTWGNNERAILSEYARFFRKFGPDEKPKTGDMIIFNEGGHVGLYLGDRKFVHSYEKTGTKIDSLTNPIWKGKVHGFFRPMFKSPGPGRSLSKGDNAYKEKEDGHSASPETPVTLLSEKIKVTYIPCLFEDKRYEFSSRNLNITSVLHSLLKRYPEIRQDSSGIVIRVNGEKIHPLSCAGFPLENGDRLLIYQEPGFLAIVAILGGSTAVGSALGVAASTVTLVATLADLAITIASVICSFVSSSAANARAVGYGTPTYGTHGAGLANSPTYGWDGIQTNTQEGALPPLIYRENRTRG